MNYNVKTGMDVHRHWIPGEYVDYIKKGNIPEMACFSHTEDRGDILEFPVPGNPKKAWIPVSAKLCDIELHSADLVTSRVNMSVICPVPFALHAHGDAQKVLAVDKILNDSIAEAVSARKDRFRGLGHLPMQDPKLAVKELRRVMEGLHLSGVQIGTNVRGKYLGDPEFEEFWEAVNDYKAVVLIHPIDVAGYDRLQAFYGRNLIGNPLETTITAGSLIFSGIFDRMPDLRIVLCHAGGMMPYIIGRWDHGYACRSECKKPQRKPSEYLRNFHYDIIAHSPESLRFLVDVVGADRVVVGSDYPLDMGLSDPIGTLEKAELPEEAFDKIMNDNARRLYGLD